MTPAASRSDISDMPFTIFTQLICGSEQSATWLWDTTFHSDTSINHHSLCQRWKSIRSLINIQRISLTVPDMLVSKLHLSVNARFNDVSVCFLTLNKASASCKVPLISLACVFASKNNKLHNPPHFCSHVHSWSVQDWTESRKCTGKKRVPGPRCLFLSGTFCDGGEEKVIMRAELLSKTATLF